MKTSYNIALLFITVLIAAGCNSKLKSIDLKILVGVWEGRSSDYSNPAKPDSLFPIMSIKIYESGKVEGTVGNATLKDCIAECSRGSFARALNLETDYKIEGFLLGRINPKDTSTVVERDIALPFNIENDTLKGTLFIEEAWTYPAPILPKIRIAKKRLGNQ